LQEWTLAGDEKTGMDIATADNDEVIDSGFTPATLKTAATNFAA